MLIRKCFMQYSNFTHKLNLQLGGNTAIYEVKDLFYLFGVLPQS